MDDSWLHHKDKLEVYQIDQTFVFTRQSGARIKQNHRPQQHNAEVFITPKVRLVVKCTVNLTTDDKYKLSQL